MITVTAATLPVEPHRAYVEMIMGLPFSLHIRGSVGATAAAEAVDAVWADLRRYDGIFSTYRGDSAISRINCGDLAVADAPKTVTEVLAIGEDARLKTGGAFDMRYAGRLDPAGVVKGWAAQRVAGRLGELAADWYLGAGGDIVLRSPSGRPWRIGIEDPVDPSAMVAVVQIIDGAIATSGRAHRGQHIVNPATGRPAGGVLQATVIGPELVWADVFATALVVDPGPVTGRWALPAGYDFQLLGDDGRIIRSAGFQVVSGP
jgi:thiamine biosynthesis lipoprotein